MVSSRNSGVRQVFHPLTEMRPKLLHTLRPMWGNKIRALFIASVAQRVLENWLMCSLVDMMSPGFAIPLVGTLVGRPRHLLHLTIWSSPNLSDGKQTNAN